jgi:nitroreductase
MDFEKLILKRRSMRQYLDEKVPRELIEKCVDAARLAPSAHNSQPWTYVVVDDDALKNKLAKEAFSGIYKMNEFAAKAPVLIVIVTENVSFAVKFSNIYLKMKYYLIDLGISAEHFCLQAEALGLGTCMLGWINQRKVKKILKLPFGKKVHLMISLGYPAFQKDLVTKRKPLKEVCRFNKYSTEE